MVETDYYHLLGVEPGASVDDIRKAYRRLARRLHPDTNPEWEDDRQANARMAAVNAAYAVLRDPTRRAEYDLERRRRLDEMAQRARAFEQAQARYKAAEPRARRTQIVFRPPVDQQVGLVVLALVLFFLSAFGASGAIRGGSVTNVALAGMAFLGGTLSAMSAMPYFQGYIVLGRDGLAEYPAFGLTGERVYDYDQICGVHWRVHRTKWGTSVRILLDYYERDKLGRLNVNYYHSKWLMSVDDPHALFYVLRRRATAHKYGFTRPTWRAVVVGARELFAMMVVVFGLLACYILSIGNNP